MGRDNWEADWALLRPTSGRGRALQLVGREFGRLRVVKRAGSDKHGASLWRCKCECGKEKTVSRGHLRSGKVKSCGCLMVEYQKSTDKPQLWQNRNAARPLVGVGPHPEARDVQGPQGARDVVGRFVATRPFDTGNRRVEQGEIVGINVDSPARVRAAIRHGWLIPVETARRLAASDHEFEDEYDD